MEPYGASKQNVEEVKEFGKDEGLIHEAVVMGRKVGAGKNFWAALAHNEGLFERVVKFVVQGINQTDFLTLISGNESLILDSVDGKEILAEAKDVFGYIDPDFKNWGADKKGPATKETPVQVYEMIKDATFQQMFSSLSSDPSKLCLTQTQIIGFVKKHRNWLKTDGSAAFFLFESNKKFFVAFVRVGSGASLRVRVSRFEHFNVWVSGFRHRLVVPQLAV